MSSIQITLDPVALREATSQAIMGILTPEVRAQVIQNAISAILKPSTDSWNREKSPLLLAFEQAVQHIAREEAKRLVAEDPQISAKVRELMRTTADKVLSADPDKLAERMAEAFRDSLRSDR